MPLDQGGPSGLKDRTLADYYRQRADKYGPKAKPTVIPPPQDEKLNVFKDIGDWIKGLGDGKGAWDWINWEGKKDEGSYLPGKTKVLGTKAEPCNEICTTENRRCRV